jgi:hypothetical protein
MVGKTDAIEEMTLVSSTQATQPRAHINEMNSVSFQENERGRGNTTIPGSLFAVWKKIPSKVFGNSLRSDHASAQPAESHAKRNAKIVGCGFAARNV